MRSQTSTLSAFESINWRIFAQQRIYSWGEIFNSPINCHRFHVYSDACTRFEAFGNGIRRSDTKIMNEVHEWINLVECIADSDEINSFHSIDKLIN